MPTVNIRIIELLTNEKHSAINSFHILIRANDFPNHVFKLKIYENKYNNILSGDKPSTLLIRRQKNNFLSIDLKRFNLIGKNDLIGQLVLPLEWFPTNHIVREWFPIQKTGQFQGGMILLDIHVDSRNALPFMAPFAALRVYPCWKRPTLGENCEIPIVPPIVYLIPSKTPNSQIQNQNLVPQVQEYVNVVDLPVNPYSINDNKSQINFDQNEFDDGYYQQTENQQNLHLIEQENQNNHEKPHFQIYSLDISDDEKLNDDIQNEQKYQQYSTPEIQQFSSVYYPSLSLDLEN